MPKLLKQKINRLYYGKWPYKIECLCDKSSLIVRLGPVKSRSWAMDHSDHALWGNVPRITKLQFLEFLNHVEPFLKEDLQIRTEGNRFNIFCRDSNLHKRLLKELKSWIVSVHGPANTEELEYMLANGRKKVVCNSLPHKQYNYKVYLKTNTPIDTKANFLSWVKNYSEQVHISDCTYRWLSNMRFYEQRPFLYVEDSKTLTLIGMFLGNNLRTVEEFVLRSSINTSLDQEI